MPPKKSEKTLKEHLREIEKILAWFDAQEDLDVEEALAKVKEAAGLIAESKKRLQAVENEFEEITRTTSND